MCDCTARRKNEKALQRVRTYITEIENGDLEGKEYYTLSAVKSGNTMYCPLMTLIY